MVHIFYFSRSGISKGIAEKIAARLSTKAYNLNDGSSWKGFTGFLKGGYMSVKKKTILPFVEEPFPPEEGDIIIVTPVWADSLPPIVRGAATLIQKKGKKILLVMTSAVASVEKVASNVNADFDNVIIVDCLNKKVLSATHQEKSINEVSERIGKHLEAH